MKKSRKFAISGIKQVASIVLVLSMIFALVGCGEDSESDAKMTTEDFGTEAEVDGVQEPNQEIDEGALLPETTTEVETTEATTEEETTQPTANNGSYEYTVYGGIKVTLPFDIEDYVTVTDYGELGFKAYYLATDYGWKSIDDRDDYFYYDCGDFYVYFKLEEPYDEDCGFQSPDKDFHASQIKSCQLWFSPPNEPGEWYYGDTALPGSKERSIEVDFSKHYSECQYIYLGASPNTVLSKDDIIIIAYLLSFVNSNPGEGHPFYYLDLGDSVRISVGGRLTSYYLP